MSKVPVIITTDKRGVFMGYIDEKDATNQTIKAEDVHMCVYWSENVKGVLGLAATGPDEKSRVTKAAPSAILHGVTGVIGITKKAEKAWLSTPWGK